MLLRLMLLMTIVPAVELALLIQVHGFFATYYGGFWGLFVTIGTIIFTGILGANLARNQGFSVLQRMQSQMQSGQLPTSEVADGVMILFGGALLLTPGFMTDFVGFAMLFPLSRQFFKKRLIKWTQAKVASGELNFGSAASSGSGGFYYSTMQRSSAPQSARPVDPDVIDAEIIKD